MTRSNANLIRTIPVFQPLRAIERNESNQYLIVQLFCQHRTIDSIGVVCIDVRFRQEKYTTLALYRFGQNLCQPEPMSE